MIEQRRGSIINIGSLAGSEPRPVGTAYCSTKAALHMLSQCLAEDVREYNIAVNILNPGPMKSEGSSIIPWAQHDWHERVQPEEVGPSAVYLALQDPQSLTGQLVLREEFGRTWGV
jgi:NAD(P)-dependent dehydrogenase (short-subunit alcohol dehydrogenase family)